MDAVEVRSLLYSRSTGLASTMPSQLPTVPATGPELSDAVVFCARYCDNEVYWSQSNLSVISTCNLSLAAGKMAKGFSIP